MLRFELSLSQLNVSCKPYCCIRWLFGNPGACALPHRKVQEYTSGDAQPISLSSLFVNGTIGDARLVLIDH